MKPEESRMSETPSKHELWLETQRKVRALFAQLKEDANGQVAVPDEVKTGMAALKRDEESWDNNRRVFTFGTGNTQQNVLAARANLIPWWPVLTAAVFFGAIDDVRYTKPEADKHAKPNQQPSLNSALSWVAFPYTLVGNIKNKIEPEVIKQLMEWGANPNHENGKWFASVLSQQNTDIINIYLDHDPTLDN